MKKEVWLKNLGAKIRDTRIAKGLTQAQLAHTINKDQQSVQRLEAGNINPSFYYLVEVAKGLGVNIAELVTGL
ncbi:MAG: XRE family transcriptional regulator [Sphingobacteriales bacterium]|nr:MAG: XRE family transcriptional regulator [Sphingobacteriales bacterium]